MTDEVSLVVRAWLDEGSNPAYHRAMRRKLSREWPSLYAAIEALVRERTATEADCPCWGCQSRTTEKGYENQLHPELWWWLARREGGVGK